jgi:uncharacterized damage-inducible protein DinB
MVAATAPGAAAGHPCASQTATGIATCEPVALPLAVLVRELLDVLAAMTPAQFAAPTGHLFSNGAIGGHVRHCLDHVRAVVDGAARGVIDYDHRARGTCIETDVAAAAAEAARLHSRILDLAAHDRDVRVHVAVMAERNGPTLTLASTLARELAFVLSHTVHHNAIIRAMALSLGVTVPDTLGYAPSTLAHMDASACAR